MQTKVFNRNLRIKMNYIKQNAEKIVMLIQLLVLVASLMAYFEIKQASETAKQEAAEAATSSEKAKQEAAEAAHWSEKAKQSAM